MEKKIVFVRLITGEELLTTHVFTSDETFTFENTIQLFVGPPKAPNEPPQLGFVPFLPYTNAGKKAVINRSHVQLMADPIPQLSQEYQRATGSVITPAKPGIIL